MVTCLAPQYALDLLQGSPRVLRREVQEERVARQHEVEGPLWRCITDGIALGERDAPSNLLRQFVAAVVEELEAGGDPLDRQVRDGVRRRRRRP